MVKPVRLVRFLVLPVEPIIIGFSSFFLKFQFLRESDRTRHRSDPVFKTMAIYITTFTRQQFLEFIFLNNHEQKE